MAASTKSKVVNMGGLTLVVDKLVTGKSSPAQGNGSFSTVASGQIVDRINVVNVTTATRTVTADESGTLFLLNKADGIVFTLPDLTANNVGLYYDFLVNTSVTSNSYKWSTFTQGTEFFIGTLPLLVAGTADIEFFTANGTTHDNITMAGTTTGGLVPTRIRIESISATQWTVSGYVGASGTPATPFTTT